MLHRLQYLIIFCLAGLLSCRKADITLRNPNSSLRPASEFVKNNFEFSLFYAAIEKAGLVEELNGRGPYTIIAPSNSAFNEWGILRPSDFDRYSVDFLKGLVYNHVVPLIINKESIPMTTLDNEYKNLRGTELYFSRWNVNFGIAVNGGQIDKDNMDIPLSNGVFHEIDKVLKYDDRTLQEWLLGNKDYRVLVAGLKRFDVWDRLNEGQWTIMAPADSIFEKKGLDLERVNELNISQYGPRLFSAYLFATRFFTSDLDLFISSGGINSYAFGNASLRVPIVADSLFSNGINYSYNNYRFFVIESLPLEGTSPIRYFQFNKNEAQSDFTFKNGVLHTVDQLIVLPEESKSNVQ